MNFEIYEQMMKDALNNIFRNDEMALSMQGITAPSQQVLKRLEVVKLKGLVDLELDFEVAGLTAIMGANCSGKTTVLHALACTHSPQTDGDPDYRFPMFFKPNSDALWSGSDFSVSVGFRLKETTYPNVRVKYTKQGDRWAPRYSNRPKRSVRYLSIRDSIPDMESINLNSMIHYTRSARTDATSEQIMEAAGIVLNRIYTTYDDVQYRYLGRRSIGVTLNGLKYAGLAMSSGEQRVFKIIDTVFSAPKYALILIDELDLFLHQEAMERLVDVMIDHCDKQKKQLVFTTHFPAIADLYDKVNVKTIHPLGGKTTVWSGYSYDALRFITGKQSKPLSIHVEDDVAHAIVAEIVGTLGMRKYVDIVRYGAAKNAFTLGAGLILKGGGTGDTLIVLDGDVYQKEEERKSQIGNALTGTAPENDKQREILLSMVVLFKTVDGLAPEPMLHQMLQSLSANEIKDEAVKELLHVAMTIHTVPEKHGYVDRIIELSGEESRAVALKQLLQLASQSPYWPTYIEHVKHWLELKKSELNAGKKLGV